MATPVPDNAARFALAEVAQACGVGCASGEVASRVTESVCTDSRRASPNCLYVALAGTRFDGHQFLSEVRDAGAGAAVVRKGTSGPLGLPLIEVPDPLVALGDLAAFHRRRWGGQVVAITGSAGKTTTKELTAAALSTVSDCGGASVIRTIGNLNNLIGVPMTLFTLTAAHSIAVIEMGTSQRGEIARLSEIVGPDIGVVTAVAVAHAQGLDSLPAIAAEKSDLLRALPAAGTAIYSADHPLLREQARTAIARHLSFGTAHDADVRLSQQRIYSSAAGRLVSVCRYSWPGSRRSQEVSLAMLGDGAAVDGAAALAVVCALLGPSAAMGATAGLGRVLPVSGRLSPTKGPAGSIILDDSYNANPESMVSSLRSLRAAAIATGGRALAVLGDMKELGAHSRPEHEAIGDLCVRYRLSCLIGCGPEMVAAVESARAAGMTQAHSVPDAESAIPGLADSLRKNDVLLVKGSRSMAMDRIVEQLAHVGRPR